MQQKAVIAIGLMVLLITAGVSGYMLYSRSTGSENSANDSAHKSETIDAQQNIEPAPSVEVGGTDISEGLAADYDEAATPETTESSRSQPRQPDSSEASTENKSVPTHTRGKDNIDRSTRKRASDAVKQILSKARSHKPRGGQSCKSVKTPAVHVASGVRYNFSYDCLPKGWVPLSDRSGPRR